MSDDRIRSLLRLMYVRGIDLHLLWVDVFDWTALFSFHECRDLSAVSIVCAMSPDRCGVQHECAMLFGRLQGKSLRHTGGGRDDMRRERAALLHGGIGAAALRGRFDVRHERSMPSDARRHRRREWRRWRRHLWQWHGGFR